MARAKSAESGRTPPSPWIGSTTMAAVADDTAASQRRDVARRDERHPGDQRLERLAIVGVRGHRERAHRPPGKPVLEGHEPRPRGRPA